MEQANFQDSKFHNKLSQRFLKANAGNMHLLTYSLVVGVISGVLSSLFRLILKKIELFRSGLFAHYTFSFSSLIEGAGLLLLIVVPIILAVLLVKKFAPEASGSGIHEIEGALDEVRPVRWKRLLPVKFFASILSLGSGMLLGREGPTVQMGANVGKMVKDVFKQSDEHTNSLLSAGAAAGLAGAFNAPLSGIVFVIEEMQGRFKFNFYSLASIMIGSCTADFVVRYLIGPDPIIKMDIYQIPNLSNIGFFVVLGVSFGLVGYVFNYFILKSLDFFEELNKPILFAVGIGVIIAGLCLFFPDMVGPGYRTISNVLAGNYALSALLMLFLVRMVLSVLSYSAGVPGGIFAPLLSLGVIFGMIFGFLAQSLFPGMIAESEIGVFAVAGMAAIFAATVRAPLTGIMLALEMTSNYKLTLPLIFVTITASTVTTILGNQPIYTSLLKRTLNKKKTAPES